jgi:folate-binding protein YgfZ
MPYASLLDERAVIAIKGPDARSFLQGLISNDMEECAPGRGLYAALLTPQGKILFEFLVTGSEQGFLIDCAAARSGDLVKRLTFYRLRAKLDIALASDLAVAALWDGERQAAHPPGLVSFPDPRLPALGARVIGRLQAIQDAIAALPAGGYREHRLRLGIPDSADLPPDSVFALDAGLEELNGVDFKKGCYVGQEVTARMKHRASARRRFLIADIDGDLPPPGTKLEASGREIGALATGANRRALALVRLDRVDEATNAGASITALGRNVSLHKPAWLRA